MSFSAISEKLQRYNPQVHTSQENIVINTTKLFFKGQTDFEPNTLYVGIASSFPSEILGSHCVNLLCIYEEEIPFNYTENSRVNLIILVTNIDLFKIFNAIQDIFSVHHQLLVNSLKLTESFLKGHSLQQIIDAASEVLGNPLTITDSGFKVIAYTKNNKIKDQIWEELVLNGKLPDFCLDHIKNDRITEKIYKNNKPVISSLKYSKYRNILGKVNIDKKLVANIGVIEYFKPFADQDIEIVSLLCQIISAEMQKYKLFRSTKRVIYEHFIIDILDGKLSSTEDIKEKGTHIDLKLKDNLYVLTINIEEYEIQNTTISYAKDQLEGILAGSKSVIYNEQIILIIDRSKENPITESELLELSKYLKKNKMSCGISRCFSDFSGLRKYYLQSLSALKLGKVIEKEKIIYYYEDYAIFHLMDICSEVENIKDYCHPALSILMDYDHRHGTYYTNSLYIYLDNSKSIVESSRLLNIHRNTMSYRIEKIQEITKLNLDNKDILFHLQLSYKILLPLLQPIDNL